MKQCTAPKTITKHALATSVATSTHVVTRPSSQPTQHSISAQRLASKTVIAPTATSLSTTNVKVNEIMNKTLETFLLKCTQNTTDASGIMQCQHVSTTQTIQTLQASQASKASLVEGSYSTRNQTIASSMDDC